jgi:cytochrome o ubiquinol oxidase operon protein cyoD
VSAAKGSKFHPAIVCGLVLALFGLIVAAQYRASRSPVQVAKPNDGKREEVRRYAIGYGFALALTCAAFATVHWPSFASTMTLAIVLGLAVVQMVVHFRFFLHISLRKSARDDLYLILFSSLIVMLMISGTLVILLNLRARMM